MEYPGAKFTRPWRRATLIVFLAAFCLLAPTIVLYTTGYRYDWRYGLLRETGSISVDVLPRNATVSLDGLELPDRIPVRLKNITPHTYLLKIAAPGYYDWDKEVTVENRETTYIKDISLLRKSRPDFLTKAHITQLVKPGTGHYVLFIDEQKGSTLVRRLNTQTGIAETILLTSSSTTINCATANSWCALNESSAVRSHVVLFDTEAPLLSYPQGFIDLGDLVRAPLTKVSWDSDAAPIAYFSTASTIYALPISSRELQTLGSNSGWDWFARGGVAWTLRTTTSSNDLAISVTNNGVTTPLSIITNEKLGDPKSIKLLDVSSDDDVLLANSNAMLLVSAQKSWSLSTTHFIRSPFTGWLLLFGPDEIWGKEPGHDPTLIYRASEPITDILTLDQYNTLTLLTNKRLTAFFHYYLVAQDLVNKKINTAVADTVGKNIYYADKDGLWQLSY